MGKNKKVKVRITTLYIVWGMLAVVLAALVICLFISLTILERGKEEEHQKRLSEIEVGRYQLLAQDTEDFYQEKMRKVLKANEHHFTATGYTSSKEECGNTKGITASGKKARKFRTVAVSREYSHWMGKRVLVYDDNKIYGEFTVEDLTAPHLKKTIDVYFGDRTQKWAANEFGTKKVKVVLL